MCQYSSQLRKLGINHLLSRTVRLLYSYILSTPPSTSKSLLRILKFRNMKNTILQLSTKPVTPNVSWVSWEPEYAAQREHLSHPGHSSHISKLKAKVFFSCGHEHGVLREVIGAFSKRASSLLLCLTVFLNKCF